MSSYGQSKLPPCSTDTNVYRHNCTGTYTFASGTKYDGEFKDNKYNGQGTLTFAIGNKYVGEFRDHQFHGQGTYTFRSGNKYVGEFKDHQFHGKGVYTYANGSRYIGEFKDDKNNGQGTFYTPNGSILNQGIWVDDRFVGSSLVQQALTQNTSSQITNYVQSQLPTCQSQNRWEWSNCIGSITYPSNDKYVGEFKFGKSNGKGVYTYANGSRYVGEFKDDKNNGQGTFYTPNGSILNQGIWVDDRFVSSSLVQQATVSSNEIEKLRAEAELEKRRRQELEEQLRIAQLQTTQPFQSIISPPIGKRVALVVGNNNYKVRPLKNSRNDADDMSRALRNSGFEVIDLRDSTLPQMRTAVRQFGDKLLNYDVGLVYYSGHGVENKGRNYFIPVNADILREDEIADQGLDVSLILEKMNTAQKSVNILIVDACRDDPFGRTFRSTSKGLAQMDAPRGTIIAYATSPGKVASDGDPRERNSPYTKHLLRAMQAPNKPIEQVFKDVRRAVQDETKNQQTPWENTSLSGDFYFSVKK